MESYDNKEFAAAAAYRVMDFVNSYGCDEKEFAKIVCGSHRTLRQSFMRPIREVIVQMSENGYDDRNEASVMLAKELRPIFEAHQLPFI